MKIKINKEKLIYNINLVNRAVVNKSTMNILECILLIADENGIKLISNNLDMGIETNYFDAEITEQGKIAIEGKFFSDVVKSSPASEIVIETDDKFLINIKSGMTEMKISGRDPEVFPLLPEITEDSPYIINGKIFREMIKKTSFAVAVENIKQVLTGELIEINDNNINMVAIDGYRIAYVQSQIIKGNGDDFSVIVPGNALKEIQNIISTEEEMKIYFTESHMLVKFKDCILLTSLIEGEYLKYKQFFINDYKTKVVLKRDEMLSCLERVLLISRDSKKSPVKIVIKEGGMKIFSVSETVGSIDEWIDCDVSGNELTIGFNPKYLQDIFKNIDEDEVTLTFNSVLSPCVINGESDYKYLLLPLRL